MDDVDLTKSLLDWSSTFIRLSLYDFNRYTRSMGLSLGQMTVLMHLHYQGPCEVTRFCDMMQITPAGASNMIERMVQQGVVRRDELPEDRRVRLVDLTDSGRRIVLEGVAMREAWVTQLVASLSTEEREKIFTAMMSLNQHAELLATQSDSSTNYPHPSIE
jgi:MarR family 2-MHQ and catechol resistance regulon transcriptional repressor